ncbi:MAG TPA: TM0106 family RecB-like putative nuclease [Acidimicrobiales bacterium]|nr:TM0106 family RecB-like putative nuclease [Acidimicrobiales bacterium]
MAPSRHFADSVAALSAAVLDEVGAYAPGSVTIGAGLVEERVERTVAAMHADAPLIIHGQLPVDRAGRRTGAPDLLVRGEGPWYRPVVVKGHRSLEPGSGPLGARIAALSSPTLETSRVAEGSNARKHRGDVLQLAHYRRLLEACGFAAPADHEVGVIGTEREVVWYDLAAPAWMTPSSSGKQKKRTSMEIYDFEFDFRLDIMAAAQEHAYDPAIPLLVVPVRTGECDACHWRAHCGRLLSAGHGDVSLLPRTGWRAWKVHHDHGVHDRMQLARLDHRTAELVVAGIDVAGIISVRQQFAPETALIDVLGSRKSSQLDKLHQAGLRTIGDCASLCERTASYGDVSLAALPEQIDMARAALGPSPAYRRRGVATVDVPSADIEVDVDMENTEAGVYLWGAYVTAPAGLDWVEPGYVPFVTWEALSSDEEVALFARFWRWLDQLRGRARGTGLKLVAYCYNAGAENGQMTRLAPAAGLADEVKKFVTSDQWVDLLRVFDSQLITGTGVGLKEVAPLAGFHWEVDDPGGAMSMLYYDQAVRRASSGQRTAAQAWLLTYNRNDVQATAALRRWLRTDAARCLPVEVLAFPQ